MNPKKFNSKLKSIETLMENANEIAKDIEKGPMSHETMSRLQITANYNQNQAIYEQNQIIIEQNQEISQYPEAKQDLEKLGEYFSQVERHPQMSKKINAILEKYKTKE